MYKRMKKWFAVVLACVMVIGMAACGTPDAKSEAGSDAQSSVQNASGSNAGAQVTELTAFAMEGPYTKGDFNDLPIWALAEEATGVKVTFESAPSASFQEKLNLKFASNQLPDIFFKTDITTKNITKYSSEGTLIPLDDYLSEHAPNFSSYLKEDESIEKNIRMADGKIYSFPYLVTASPSRISPKLFINEAWLETLKMDMPETTEDFYELLKAMKEYDYNGNGETDEIPLSCDGIGMITKGLMGSFGLMTRGAAQEEWDIDPETGELRFIKTSDAYKAFLEYCNRLYTEKLMDQEVFTMDIPKLTAKAQQNILGVVFTHNSNYLGDYQSDYGFIPAALTGPDGDRNYAGRTIPVANQCAFLTKTNEHPEESVKWIDWFYSPEGIEHYFMGIEGDTYEIGEDGLPHFTEKVTNNPEGLNMEEVLGRYICWSGGANPSVADDIHFGNHLIPEVTVNAAGALMEDAPEEVWGQFVYATEDSERLSVLTTDISTYLTDMTAKFITGEADFGQWEDYKSKVDKMGHDEYREIVQRALDNYNEK